MRYFGRRLTAEMAFGAGSYLRLQLRRSFPGLAWRHRLDLAPADIRIPSGHHWWSLPYRSRGRNSSARLAARLPVLSGQPAGAARSSVSRLLEECFSGSGAHLPLRDVALPNSLLDLAQTPTWLGLDERAVQIVTHAWPLAAAP